MQVPSRVTRLVILLAVITALVLITGAPRVWLPPASFESLLLGIVLVVLIVGADFFDIDLPLSSVRVTVSVSSALCFAAALSLGPAVGAIVAAIGALLVEVIQRRPLIKLLVNVNNYTLATFFAGLVYFNLANLSLSPIGDVTNIAVTIASASVYTAVSTITLATILSQVVGTSPWRMWQANVRGVAFEGLTLPTLGSLVPVLNDQNPLALMIVVIPLMGPYLAFRSYGQIHKETRRTIELLADMLDRRDPYTSEHSRRVSIYAQAIVDEMDDLSFEEGEEIVAAARVHDLGKIGTSDLILMKPGRLTDEEKALMENHSREGEEILTILSMYRNAATLVRHHHENWNGTGYPDGRAGEAIPLGSRIIAVADAFDAMTSDRVYRRALSRPVAMAEIRRHAGTQFDPQVVAAFERAMLGVSGVAEAPQLSTAATE